jgi:hypothetical protein
MLRSKCGTIVCAGILVLLLHGLAGAWFLAPAKDGVTGSDPPTNCSRYASSAAIELRCYGEYCDRMQLKCATAPRTFAQRTWTRFFSEEGTNYGVCPDGAWVTGLLCRGEHCDDLSLECTKVLGTSHNACTRSAPFSEEQTTRPGPAGYWIRGVWCYGRYCDDLVVQYCRP